MKTGIDVHAGIALGYLKENATVVIAEQHNKSHGRELARELLDTEGAVDTFFIEYGPFSEGLKFMIPETIEDVDPHKVISMGSNAEFADADDCVWNDAFHTPLRDEAEPKLEDLAKLAYKKKIRVIAADVLIAKGYDRVNQTKLALRDGAAAKVIAYDLKQERKRTGGALLLWGAEHFDKQRNAECLLHQMEKLGVGNIFVTKTADM